MATAIQPNPAVAVTDALGKAQRDWLNYWSTIATNASSIVFGTTAGTAAEGNDSRFTGAPFLPLAGGQMTGTIRSNTAAGAQTLGIRIVNSPTGSNAQQPWWHNFIHSNDGMSSMSTNLMIQQEMTNAAWRGPKVALTASAVVNVQPSGGTPTQLNVVGVEAVAASNYPLASGSLFGINTGAGANAGATGLLNVTAAEFNVFISTSASAQLRSGISVACYANGADAGLRGTLYDAALSVSMLSSARTWGYALLVSDYNGAFPLDNTSTVIGTTAGSVLRGIDFNNLTFSGDIIRSPNFSVNSTGNVVFGSTTTVNWNSTGNTSTTATAGVQTLPANPFTFLRIQIDGTNYKIPIYNS